MCVVMRLWQGHSFVVAIFLTYVGACGVVVSACG